MKIKDKIRFMGLTIPVIITDDRMEGGDTGRFDTEQIKIFIKKSMDHQLKETTYIHEYIEAINELCNLGLNESKIRTLEQGMYQFIKQHEEIK